MTATEQDNSLESLIHVAKTDKNYFFLRQRTPILYEWVKTDNESNEEGTEVFGLNIEEAVRKANRAFKHLGFKSLDCGYLYTLPERDEHGINAYFFQMKESYRASNGVYFDKISGNNCLVQSASLQALNLMQQLKQQNRL